jgi:5-methylcytosine-specific restriction endonuclease McrA
VKTCRICGVTKPSSEFQHRKGAKDGLRNDCRSCNLERQHAYGRENQEKLAAKKRKRYLSNRQIVIEQRRRERAQRADEINARRRELRELHPERFRSQKTAWLRNNPTRAEAHAIQVKARQRIKRTLDPVTVGYIQTVRKDPCSYCGASAGTWDHIVALSKGGASDWTNATGACVRCNSSKQNDGLLSFLLRVPA